MSTHLHIALLECDELSGKLKERYGSITSLYKTFLEAAASKLEESEIIERPDLYVSSYDVVDKQDYPDLEKIDAIFLTGSRKSSQITSCQLLLWLSRKGSYS
jgi:hypothetical protein